MYTLPLEPAIFASGLITIVDPLLTQRGPPFAMLSHICYYWFIKNNDE